MDEREFADRARAMEDKLYRVAYAILRHDQDCADALQEALLRAWRGMGSLRHGEYFETWLTRILINQCKKLRRRRPPAANMPPPAQVDNRPLYEALNGLSDKLRLPLTLHYLEGYQVEEIGRMLNIPAGTVKSRLYHGRVKLKELLEREAEA